MAEWNNTSWEIAHLALRLWNHFMAFCTLMNVIKCRSLEALAPEGPSAVAAAWFTVYTLVCPLAS